MYVTVRNYTGTPGLADELVRNEGAVKELITAINGFHAYYLVKTSDGSAVSISVYDDQAGAEESTRQAREWIQSNLPDMAAGPPEVIVGEVVIEA